MRSEEKSIEALQAENRKLQKELFSLQKGVDEVFSTLTDKAFISKEIYFDEKLSRIKERLTQKEFLIHSSGEFVGICNDSFQLDFLNQTAVNLLTISAPVSNNNFTDFIKEKKIFKDKIIPRLIQKNGWIGELTIQTENRVFPATCKIIPFYSSKKSPIGFYIILRDITESKEAIKKLVDAKNKAENNMMVRQQFLAKISHEIRTSMSAIIGLSNLMIEKGLKGSKLEFAHAIKLSADNLLVIINDILDISKIESGNLTVENIRFDFKKLMLGLKSIFQHKIESGGIKFKYSIDPKIPQYLTGDPTRLNQILLNLLSNSEKFTEQGEISLSAKLVKKSSKKLKVQFRVRDTGIGIAGKNLEKIFQEFIQESDNTTRLYGGTGLGLAIVKQLVRLQKGKIWVESSKNKGSSFFLEIDYGVSLKKDQKKEEITNEIYDVSLKSAKIIMAEDYPMNRLLAKSLFKKWDLNYKIVNNGIELVKQLEKNSYDVILSDIEMPEMGGLEAAQEIRKKGISTPIIAITAHSNKEEELLCKNAGMNGFLTKPFEENDLKKKLAEFLNLKTKEFNTDKIQLRENESDWKLEHCNLNYIKELSAGDDSFIDDILTVFIQEVPELLNKMSLSLNFENQKETARYAHRLQSSFLMLGREDIKKELKELECWSTEEKQIQDIKKVFAFILDETNKILNSISDRIGKPGSVQLLPIDFLMSFDELKPMKIDFTRLDEFGQGEIQFKKEIIQLYSKQTVDQIAEVEKLMDSKSYKGIGLIIHNMIASFNLIGCELLVNYSRGLEEACLCVEKEERFKDQISDYILLIQQSIRMVNERGKKEGILI